MQSIGERIESLCHRERRVFEAARPLVVAATGFDRGGIINRRDRLSNRLWLARWALGHAECLALSWERLSQYGPERAEFASAVPQDYPEEWRDIVAFAYPIGPARV